MIETKSRPYKVSEITSLIKSTLEGSFPAIAVEGEISNFRPSSTGHVYFTLKDRDALLSAVMFRNRAVSLPFAPADGMLVVARGSVSVYPKRGSYQIICESLELAGEGEILVMLEERKRRLAEEGLFDADRKIPIPMLPSRIAVVTSPTGAAVRDILHVLGRRNSGIDVVILPAPVQGDEAAAIIARQIITADRFKLGDVIIVSRGGGSLEDLLPFSDEQVVRAIALCETPVISAVGHEIDLSLSDLAADLRAPTPSAAAEIVSARRDELVLRILELGHSIARVFLERLDRARLLLRQFTPEGLERSFRVLVQPLLLRLDDAKESLLAVMERRVSDSHHRLSLSTQALEACSPFEVLKRGYAVVYRSEDKTIISGTETVNAGDLISVRFHKSGLDARVESKRPDATTDDRI
ncbi:MAG TPA: exodeoxyribonuclease VII large subunit [Spirochaetia bacterium]|nr:exodeoxyribonuclease VII large subunit [Spirochaetia bacterium]